MSASLRRFVAPVVLATTVFAGCSGQPYEPSYGYILETHYADDIPAGQLSALADGILTEAEVGQAAAAADACVAAVPGISSVEEYRWVERDGEFSGGKVEIEAGADREVALAEAQACYIRYLALIEFAWLDQWYFGEWTEENLRG